MTDDLDVSPRRQDLTEGRAVTRERARRKRRRTLVVIASVVVLLAVGHDVYVDVASQAQQVLHDRTPQHLVQAPVARMAEKAADMLITASASGEKLTTGSQLLPFELMVRASTGPAPR